MGTGRLRAAPTETADYRRGYLCGIIRGDGRIGSYRYGRTGTPTGRKPSISGLALTDLEALPRARRYLADTGVDTGEFLFQGRRWAIDAVRAISHLRARGRPLVRDVIAWPLHPSDDWCKGFLAGIFDAEGSFGAPGAPHRQLATRRSSTGRTWCLRRLASRT